VALFSFYRGEVGGILGLYQIIVKYVSGQIIAVKKKKCALLDVPVLAEFFNLFFAWS
jgi:hypothetical protein